MLENQCNDARYLPPSQIQRLRIILARLQDAINPNSADAPGSRLRPLQGERAGQWSVRVSGNWRVVFQFVVEELVDVDLTDYHCVEKLTA
ncbi:MAG: type II toxin-antitoxin system RelE/ParE family toxin [Gammaproteobacteria bacterium]|nr:type II toxin-antitoxin system RelE/ParE family toxin [Gammaproteobacteria bacterium]